MVRTLLDYTQEILSALDSDEVNSVSDTVESQQVLTILKTTYDEICSRADLNEHYTLFQLNASLDADLPVVMHRPSDVATIEWIKYNSADTDNPNVNYIDLTFYPLNDFLSTSIQLDETSDNIDTMDVSLSSGTFTHKYWTDRAPSCYTTYDDSTILFDAYNSDVDTTLQKSKTQCYGKKIQSWEETDTFVPFLDPDFSILLLNEAKALAFAELKQAQHASAERSSRRLWIKGQKSKRAINNPRSELDRLPNYGR